MSHGQYEPKSQQWAGHEGIIDELIDSHMGFLTTNARHQLNSLLGSECVHNFRLFEIYGRTTEKKDIVVV